MEPFSDWNRDGPACNKYSARLNTCTCNTYYLIKIWFIIFFKNCFYMAPTRTRWKIVPTIYIYPYIYFTSISVNLSHRFFRRTLCAHFISVMVWKKGLKFAKLGVLKWFWSKNNRRFSCKTWLLLIVGKMFWVSLWNYWR